MKEDVVVNDNKREKNVLSFLGSKKQKDVYAQSAWLSG